MELGVGRYKCFPTARKGWYLPVCGYTFRKQCKIPSSGLIYWQCTEFVNRACPARAQSSSVDENGFAEFVRLTYEHNHFPDEEMVSCAAAVADLKSEASENDSPISSLLTKKISEKPELKNITNRRAVYMKMYRARHKNRPPIPHSIDQFRVSI